MSRRAVVLGASMAGLLSARALTDTFDEVIVVDRDELGEEVTSDWRRGVPHGRHGHGLLAGGRRAMEDLLPGATDELVALGAHDGDVLEHLRFCPNGGQLRQVPSGERGLALSRPFLESYLRTRVRALPKVQIRDNTDITGLTWTGKGATTRVDGVRIQPRGGTEERLDADLVVDATGRGSRTPVWLQEMSYDKPAEDRLKVDLTYTSRLYKMTRADIDGDLAWIVLPTVENPRGGVLIAQENGQGIVTLFGILGDSAPTDDEGYREFASTLPRSDVYDAISRLTPVTEPTIFHFPASVRRRYERLNRFPAGFLVIGDAICSFNPAYGQGMSISAKEAVTLRDMLAAGGEVDARRFYRAVAPMVDLAWQIVVGGDLSFPAVEGKRTFMIKFINGYLTRLQAAAGTDASLSLAFSKVMNLLAPPPTLLRPDRALRVLLRRR